MHMEQYLDWNCRLLCSQTTADETASALQEMSDRFGYKRFCLMQDFHANTESIAAFLIRRERTMHELKPLLPRTLHVRHAPCVHLCKHLTEEAALERLTITKERLLPLQMPLTEYDDWIDLELNHLLYKKKITPLFLSFELCMVLYPEDIVQKLLRIPYAAYQFNYKSLQDPKNCQTIFKLLSKSPVLLGTAINTPEKINRYELPYYLEKGNQFLHKRFFDLLLEQNRAYWSEW